MITLEQGVELVWHAFEDAEGGEIYVKKIPSMRIVDIATAVAPEARQETTGIRPGEKLHEQMVSSEDSRLTYEYEDCYKILPAVRDQDADHDYIKDGKLVPPDFSYTSDTNEDWMTVDELRAWIDSNLGKLNCS